jgi:diguanylate cyclase (GGDEF)-like protein/PAS domain S-box-containing protein
MNMSLTSQEYQAIVENAPNLIWRAGLNTLCDYFNKTWLDFTGRTLEQEYGNGWAGGVHPEDLERCVKTFLENFEKRKPFEMEYRLLRYDGEWRWINDRGVPYYDAQGAFSGYIGSCLDVTDKVEGNIYKELSQKDNLTGALSRQYLMSQLQNSFEMAKANHSHLSVALMDIDKFKHINDNFGHLLGDSALKMFSSVVKDKIREDDLFGRYGGDEFILIFRNTTTEVANKVIGRITEALKIVALKTDKVDILLSFSVGLCDLTNETTTDELISRADQLMYEQKKRKHLALDSEEAK